MLLTGPGSVAGGSVDNAGPQLSAVDGTEPLEATPEDVDPDQVRLDVRLSADGTAAWTVEFWVDLDDGASDAFDSIAAEVDDDPGPYRTRFADRIDSTVAKASQSTDREMAADGFEVETDRQSLAREYGIIRYTFEWSGFAAVEGSELHAGDAIEGLFLDDGTRLLLSWPSEYTLTEVSPDPDDRREQAVIWRGSETEFVSGEPRLVVSSAAGGWLSSVSVTQVVAGGTLVGGLVIGSAVWYRRRSAGERSLPATPERDRKPSGPDDSAADDNEGSEEFLSNEERVLQLLESRGGRMKQQQVVNELGWSDAKTSKVVSTLREENKLESFRLGRENVLSVPDRDAQSAVGDDEQT